MIRPKTFCFLMFLLIVPGFVSPVSCRAEAKKSNDKAAAPGPVVIKSNSLEVDNVKKIVTFTGEVHAKKDDFVVDCQKMLVYYRSSPDEEKKDALAQGIDRIVATGKVRITRTEGGVATADKAVYYQEGDKLVLTGHPSVQQGKDLVKGDRITIFLKENRSIVESGGKERAQAIIFPKAQKRETP
jgi:lipopolysaccharide export system protein LptA